MYAIEFQTKIKNGIIEIPSKYASRLQENAKVILLMEEHPKPSGIIEQLLKSPIKVKSFTPLTREEIYDRQKS
jgi:hypothetical protein